MSFGSIVLTAPLSIAGGENTPLKRLVLEVCQTPEYLLGGCLWPRLAG